MTLGWADRTEASAPISLGFFLIMHGNECHWEEFIIDRKMRASAASLRGLGEWNGIEQSGCNQSIFYPTYCPSLSLRLVVGAL